MYTEGNRPQTLTLKVGRQEGITLLCADELNILVTVLKRSFSFKKSN